MRFLFIFFFLLSACGTDTPFSETRHVFPAKTETGQSILLHNGHGEWSEQMTSVAETLSMHNYTVYRVEMPPQPHDENSDFFGDSLDILDQLDDQKVYMIGLSGGGWTTTMLTAMDTRILKGYSVAGDAPVESYQGDYEQANPPIAYLDAYNLAEGRLLHIYNWGDTCCFSYIEGDIGTPYIIDYTNSFHQINNWTLQYIINDLNDQ